MIDRKIVIDGYPFTDYRYKGSYKYGGVRYSKLKQFLIDKYKVCYHCGVKVKDYGRLAVGANTPNDCGTIDHLIPKMRKGGGYIPELYRKRHNKVAKVLSCYKCNQERNDKTLKGER